MATSDSEDFESADEWEDGKELEEKPLAKTKSTSTDLIKESSVVDDMPKHHCKGDVQVETVSKDLEKKVTISGDHPLPPADLCVTDRPVTPKQDIELLKEEKILKKTDEEVVHEGESDGWDCEIEELTDDLLEVPEDNLASVENKSKEKTDTVVVRCKEDVSSVEDKSEESAWSTRDTSSEKVCSAESEPKENFDSILNKLSASVEQEQEQTASGGWGGWGGWGVTSLLSTATESVSTLTSHVSQGLSTVLESGLGVPNPEDLVKREIEDEKKLMETCTNEPSEEQSSEEPKEEENTRIFGFGRVISGVSSITKLVETASNKVVTGGLDTLETIGKKTMEVLQEGDPGLRKKRAIFSEKIVLSQVLREAKDKAEQEAVDIKDREEARKIHFETLFDDYHGLVHLEALEMLSKQCNIKLQSVLINTPSAKLPELQQDINNIKEQCELPEDDENEELDCQSVRARLKVLGYGLGVPVGNEKFVRTWDETQQWIEECQTKQKETEGENTAPTAREIHQSAISSLARLTAESVELFHKTAELLLVCEERNPGDEAKILLEMTSTLSSQVSTCATLFCECLNGSSESVTDPDTVKSHITNVFLEAANSSSYIQEAFQLLVPVLQVGVASL